jgi:methylmalonyl-CoA mutase C-terminal domain/subunit
VVGLSVLSGAHLPLCRKVGEALRERGLEEVLWIVGGNVPRRDHAALAALGVAAVFPTGSPLGDIVAFIEGRMGA